MNRKLAWILAGALMLAAIIVFALRAGSGRRQADAAAPPPARPAAAPATQGDAPTRGDASAATAPAAKGRPRTQGSWPELAAKYGGSRTNLAKKVATDLADVLDQSLELADMGARMGGSTSAADAAGKAMVRGLARRLNLTEDQQAQAEELVRGAVEKRLAAVKDLASSMHGDPGAMMEMFLAGDATARNEMTREEYDEVTGDTRQMLEDVGGFVLGRTPDRLGAPLVGDEQFNQQLADILTAEQQQQLSAYTAEQAAEQAARQENRDDRPGLPLQDGSIPAMELEQLDQAVSSAKQMAGGMHQVLEGLQNLQQNQPGAPADR